VTRVTLCEGPILIVIDVEFHLEAVNSNHQRANSCACEIDAFLRLPLHRALHRPARAIVLQYNCGVL